MLTGVPPGSIPAPLPKWSKWALALGATPNSFLVNALTYLGSINATTDPTPGEWRHVQMVWTDTVSGLKADEMIVTFDIANITNGGLDSSWTTQDYSTVTAQLAALFENWAAHMDSTVNSKEIRYYRRAYNPYSVADPYPPSGPPEHVDPWVAVGADIRPMPHQVAVTHSEITTYPRHWGRAYWPALGATSSMVGGGRLSSTFVDAWATELQTVYDNLMTAEFFPCVPTTRVNGVASRQLLGVQSIQVDNVADIIRRRRARQTTYRKVLPVSG